MSIRSRREERRLAWTLKAAGDITRPDLLDALIRGGPVSMTARRVADASFSCSGRAPTRSYRTQSAFRSVVDFLSRNIGAIHMKLSEEVATAAQMPRPDHPAMKVLDHPQPGVPYSRLMRQIVADKCIWDVAAVWKISENFNPTPNPATRQVTNAGEVVEPGPPPDPVHLADAGCR